MESRNGLFRINFIKGVDARTIRFTSQAECFRTLRKLQRNGPIVLASVELRTIEGWVDCGMGV